MRPLQHTINTTTSGPRAKCDQVIFEALCKACEIVVGSRTTIAATANSSRFNLQIPEVAGVRSILSQYRLQLHVPLRLDVYYQHPEGSRELLERWCLEYKTVSSERFLQVEGLVTNDPMVQLTHVCKRVVLWLRTLYCWTRLLCTHAVGANCKQIGFSIYVNSDYSDDVTELTENQGFLSQFRGDGVVTTPYGELAWKVLYCPPSKLERLIPTVRSVVRIQTPPRSSSRPIPVAKQQVDARQQQFAPHSAPAARPPTYTERSQQKRLEAAQQQHQQLRQVGKSYDPHRLYHRSATGSTEQHHPLTLQRSNTSIGGQSPRRSPPVLPTQNPPERVMSGLSLALMMASNDDDYSGENSAIRAIDNLDKQPAHFKYQHDNGMNEHEDEETAEVKARRAALHQMPPHLLEQSSPVTAVMTGDYGYGYNNHIPWQKIHPSNSNPAVIQPQLLPSNSFGRTLSTSPASVTSSPMYAWQTPQTPPGAVFLGATPPVGNGLGHLIPPRNRLESKSITPPFQPRPAGFLHDAPSFYLDSQQQQPPSIRIFTSDLDTSSKDKTPSVPNAPMTSLDSLRSSPFQQQQQMLGLHPESRSSMLSSLSFAPGLGSDYSSNMTGHLGAVDLRRSLWGGASGAVIPSSLAGSAGLQQPSLFQQQDDYYSEEMPFAFEIPSPPAQFPFAGSQQKQSASNIKSSASSYLGNSSALASLAQKCAAPSHRLKLFEKQGNQPLAASGEQGPSDVSALQNDLVNSLADQLQEFRAFGESLHGRVLDPKSMGEEQLPGSGTSSASTPISLHS